MGERRISRIIILCAFVAIICCSKGIWFFAEKYLKSANYENRQMASRPILALDNYATFPTDYTAFFNDNLQFREYLVLINNCIDFFVFDKSTSEQVIKGTEGWLFFKETLADFQGTNLFTQDELESIKNDVLNTKRYFEEKGIEFVIFIGPNKNSIYGDYMPQNYCSNNKESKVSQMVNYLKKNTDVKIIFPIDELKKTRKDYPYFSYYLHLDTHWNYMGGYWASKSLLEILGVESLDFESLSYTEVNEPDFFWIGYDEANMLGLSRILKNDINYQFSGLTIDGIIYEGDVKNNRDDFNNAVRTHNTGTDSRKVFLARDSFGEAITPFLAASFDEVYSVHYGSPLFNSSQVESERPDIFIFEMVERGITTETFKFKDWNK